MAIFDITTKYPDIGQIWIHCTLLGYKVRILNIEDRHVEVKCVASKTDGMHVGDTHVIDEDTLLRYYSLSDEKAYGETCLQCKRYYPYAEAAPRFKCWGCANGF